MVIGSGLADSSYPDWHRITAVADCVEVHSYAAVVGVEEEAVVEVEEEAAVWGGYAEGLSGAAAINSFIGVHQQRQGHLGFSEYELQLDPFASVGVATGLERSLLWHTETYEL